MTKQLNAATPVFRPSWLKLHKTSDPCLTGSYY